MSAGESRGALWTWMAQSRLFKRVILPLILLGVVVMFIRADVRNRECARLCIAEKLMDGYYVGSRGNDHCVCTDNHGRVIAPKVNSENLNQEK